MGRCLSPPQRGMARTLTVPRVRVPPPQIQDDCLADDVPYPPEALAWDEGERETPALLLLHF